MREHPIPQDITGYKFHIIGSMTLKQFAEVGIGAVLAFITYGTNLPSIVKWPIIIIFVVLGIVAAFLPINERPLDKWLIIFFNVLYKPTQFYWRRITKIPSVFNYVAGEVTEVEQEIDYTPIRRRKIREYMDSMKTATTIEPEPMDIQENDRLMEIMNAFDFQQAIEPVVATRLDEKPDLSVRVRSLSQDVSMSQAFLPQDIEEYQNNTDSEYATDEPNNEELYPESYQQDLEIDEPYSEEAQENQVDTFSHTEEISQNDTEINQILPDTENFVEAVDKKLDSNQPVEVFIGPNSEQKGLITEEVDSNKLAEELKQEKTKTQLPSIVTVFSTEEETADEEPENNNQSVFTSDLPPITQPKIPNQIKGIIKDKDGVILTDAVVKILGNNDTVERAVSTNALGQFSITTPLPDGSYDVSIEKKGYQFQPFAIDLNGNIIPSLEIQSL